MNLVEQNISDWLADKDVPAQDKLDHCFEVLRVARVNDCMSLEIIGKSAAHLGYRLLDGETSEEARVFTDVQWAKEHVQTMGRETWLHQSRWQGSLTILLAYMTITLRGGKDLAATLCGEMVIDEAVTVLMPNTLNVMRACLLRAARFQVVDKPEEARWAVLECQRLCKLGVAAMDFPAQGLNRGNELMQIMAMAKLSIGLSHHCGMNVPGPHWDIQRLASIETVNPFRDALWARANHFQRALWSMCQPDRVEPQDTIIDAVNAAIVDEDPFLHIRMGDVFPAGLYDAMTHNLPPDTAYHDLAHRDAKREDGTSTRQQFTFKPSERLGLTAEQQDVWRKVYHALVSPEVEGALRRVLRIDPALKLRPRLSLICDLPGYRIGIHPDVPSKVITCQFYLPKVTGSHEGSCFYRRGGKGFELVKTMPFEPNTGYAFAVRPDSWHGVNVVTPEQGERNSLMLIYYLEDTPI